MILYILNKTIKNALIIAIINNSIIMEKREIR